MKMVFKELYHLLTSCFFLLKTRMAVVDGITVKYILKRCKKSNKLLVVFSGFAGHHKKARYNYYNTLKNTSDNILFILDEYGYEKVGSYYLGEKCSLYRNNTIQIFITNIEQQLKTDYRIFLGSSKGGTAALIYGLEMCANEIIAGSPQFMIGDYLQLNDYHKKIYDSICDSENNYDIVFLNSLLPSLLGRIKNGVRITLIYSSLEQDYEADLSKLVNYLENSEIQNATLIDEKFADHSQIAFFFKKYLKERFGPSSNNN